jgi:hypothetical protein
MKSLEDIYYGEKMQFFIKYTLPAMLRNQYAPSYGWCADFTKKTYLEFIDRLYGNSGYAEEYLLSEIRKHITSYFSNEEIDEAIDYYGEEDAIDLLVLEVYENITLNDVIDFFLVKVNNDLESGNIDVKLFYDIYVFDPFDSEAFESWRKEREGNDKGDI